MKYLTIKDIVNDPNYPFTHGQMQFFLSNRKETGLEKAVRKIGKNLYIQQDKFDEWMENGGKL